MIPKSLTDFFGKLVGLLALDLILMINFILVLLFNFGLSFIFFSLNGCLIVTYHFLLFILKLYSHKLLYLGTVVEDLLCFLEQPRQQVNFHINDMIFS